MPFVAIQVAFEKCEEEVAGLKTTMEHWCKKKTDMCSGSGPCDVVEFKVCKAGCDYRTEDGSSCYKTVIRIVENLEGYFTERNAEYDGYVAKCQEFTSLYNAKVSACWLVSPRIPEVDICAGRRMRSSRDDVESKD